MTGWQLSPIDAVARIRIEPDATLGEAMARLNETALQILLVAAADGRLLGTMTDGDIRRAILRGRTLSDPIADAYNPKPMAARDGHETHDLERVAGAGITVAPVIAASGMLVGLARFTAPDRRVALVLAGGKGSRLGTLTETTPKPLLEVGEKPLLGHLLENLARSGFGTVFIAVHHLAEQIIDYAGKACPADLDLKFIREETPLGTAGALGFVPAEVTEPILVVNGDLVTRTSFAAITDFHLEHGKAITIGCAQYRHQIPFGVIEMSDAEVARIVEKPPIMRFISAGLYVLDPLVYRMVAKGQPIDMPQLLNAALEAGLGATTFPIVEYWIDIGRPDELERARGDFRQH